jgi:hypothetical protein
MAVYFLENVCTTWSRSARVRKANFGRIRAKHLPFLLQIRVNGTCEIREIKIR